MMIKLAGMRFDIKYSAPTPGCMPHKFPRSELEKDFMFRRWVREDNRHGAQKLYWRFHPEQKFW